MFYVLTPYGVHGTQHWQSSSSSPSKFSLIILLKAKFCLGLDVTCRYLVQISRWMCRINLQFCSKFQVPEAIGIRILGCSPKEKKKIFPFYAWTRTFLSHFLHLYLVIVKFWHTIGTCRYKFARWVFIVLVILDIMFLWTFSKELLSFEG